MLARAQLRAAPSARVAGGDQQGGCRLIWARSAPPVAFRATPDGVYLVGTAATPVGADEVVIEVIVEAGARLVMRSAASAIAWASTGARLEIVVTVEPGGQLDWHLKPLVASSRCQYRQVANVQLAEGASARWVEEIVLGRHNEEPGSLALRLDFDYAGRPLLRHEVRVGPGATGWDGPGVLGVYRAVSTVVGAGPAQVAEDHSATTGTEPSGDGPAPLWAFMELDGPGFLAQAMGQDLTEVRRCLFRIPAAAAR
ncbi:MAG TPA: urease accessory protein UreD [Acidimicrobiales bacterium]|nr:urease accessory protein UreD [Acidimicrobiales bacterium]